VRGDAGAQPTYEVVTDELVAAAQAVLRVTYEAAAATVENLPARVFEVRHAGLATAFRDFCARSRRSPKLSATHKDQAMPNGYRTATSSPELG
jgi:hypothetical protein